MTIFSASDPVSNQPYLAINGFQVSNDATTPNTLLDLSAGLCRDSTNTFDINLGNWFGEAPSLSANTSTIINAAINGPLGLDTGTFAEASFYYVHVIFDATGYNIPSALISLSRTAPLLPAGYSNFRWIGSAATISNAIHFLPGYNYGAENERLFMYDAPQSVGTTATEAAYTAISLAKLVPAINNIPVWLSVVFTPGTAGDTLSLQPGNATAATVVITGPVISQPYTHNVLVMAQLVAGVPTINYKNSGTDTVAISVLGYQYSL